MPSRKSPSPAAPVDETNPVTESVERLTDELRSLGTVLESIREDVSWVTWNMEPVLSALDEVRATLLSAMKRQRDDEIAAAPVRSAASTSASTSAQRPSSSPEPRCIPPDAPSGQLF